MPVSSLARSTFEEESTVAIDERGAGKFAVRATMGMVLGKSLYFSTYEEASELAHLMLEGQPIGQVEVVRPDGKVVWSYSRKP